VPESPAAPAQLFYSYSHKDEKLRDRLEVHLSALKREGLISGWHDRKIGAGTEWKDAIDDNLKAASIILLLVSADFLASDYCYDVELKYAMERHEQGNARVIPVILQPCDWQTSPFAKLQALPKDAKPVTKWPNRNSAFVDIAAGIRKALKDLGNGRLPGAMTKPVNAAPVLAVSGPQQSSSAISVLNALHQLPTPPADFTGRTDELKELLAAVKTGGVTISGLQGMGGVGKTALALKLAEQLKPDYPDAQFYVDLKGVTQPLSPKEAMAHVIRAWDTRAQLPEKDEEIAALYRSALDGKRALLLMDNARDAQQVRPLIPPASCVFLVTSRQHFKLSGSITKDLGKLPHADACKLLIKIAPRLAKERQEEIDRLALLCGQLALALEKVASALHVKENISAGDYIRRLAEARERLELTETDAALQSSYELLSGELRQKFRFLSVFPGTFDLAAAAAMWDIPAESSQDALGELLAYSLINFDKITNRYSLHDLVRLFAGQLLNADEQYNAQKRHGSHYLKVLGAADGLYLNGGESVAQGLALFDLEVTNIRAGHDWVVAHQQDDNSIAEWCFQYPNAGAYCLALRQHPREQIRWLESALAAARRLKQRPWEGIVLGNLGIEYDNLGEYQRAIEHHEQHLEIAREVGDRLGEANALGNLGLVYHNLGEYRRAIECLEQVLQTTREIGNRLGENLTLGNLGIAYDSLGEYHRAIEYHDQRLQIAREIGDRLGEGNTLGNLGAAYNNLGKYRRAIEYQEQSLQIAREIGDRPGEANALWNSALALDQLGDRPAAIVHAEAALEIYQAIESPYAAKTRDQLAKWRGGDKASG